MSDSIMIRRAKQDYVCLCCGHIIHKGDEYLDKVILNVGKIVKHDRYHDECPKQDTIERLLYALMREKGDLICADHAGNKIHVIGFYWGADDIKVEYRDWASPCINSMPLKELASEYRDVKGDKLI